MRCLQIFVVSLLCAAATPTLANDLKANLAAGEETHKKCALCHGQWSQGIPGGLYPRLAGLPAQYLIKQVGDYKKNLRPANVAMITVGGFNTMSEQELFDLASFIASIDLKSKQPLNIPTAAGDVTLGNELYKDDCKSCHGSKGEGKPAKVIPPMAGQYSEYLEKQIQDYKAKKQHHDNDPKDDTFDEYKEEEIRALLAYMSTLDDE